MTFDEMMKQGAGYWAGEKAWARGQGSYMWNIAVGSPDNYTITNDGKRHGVSVDEPKVAPKKVGLRKPAVKADEVVTPEPAAPDAAE